MKSKRKKHKTKKTKIEKTRPELALFSKKRKLQESKKKKMDENDAARVYEEFVASFSEKSGAINPNIHRNVFVQSGSNSVYNPNPINKTQTNTLNSISKNTSKPIKKRKTKKTIRNIDIFMEELKTQEKHRQIENSLLSSSTKHNDPPKRDSSSTEETMLSLTNVYVGNLPLHVTELMLLTEFSKLGQIGSVKIILPRNEFKQERIQRTFNCGFINFMRAEDANKAVQLWNGKCIFGQNLRVSWGKNLPKPEYPIQLPIQLPISTPKRVLIPKDADIVRIQVPENDKQRRIIDLVAQYVSREGYALEQCIADERRNSPEFSFLFDTQSKMHLYYRWRLYSLVQKDSLSYWRMEPFQIVEKGPFWVPPKIESSDNGVNKIQNLVGLSKSNKRTRWEQGPNDGLSAAAAGSVGVINSASITNTVVTPAVDNNHYNNNTSLYTQHQQQHQLEQEQHLISAPTHSSSITPFRKDRLNKRSIRPLNTKNREYFEDLLRNLTKDRYTIKQLMGFCIDNSENAIEIVETITDSLTLPETEIPKKIARLFLVSDILHNSNACVRNSSAYRSEFQITLREIFQGLRQSYVCIDGRISADKMKEEVLTVLRVWQAWSLFPVTFLDELEDIFLPQLSKQKENNENLTSLNKEIDGENNNEDIDGEPFDESEINDIKDLKDGNKGIDESEDIDGEPFDDEDQANILF